MDDITRTLRNGAIKPLQTPAWKDCTVKLSIQPLGIRLAAGFAAILVVGIAGML